MNGRMIKGLFHRLIVAHLMFIFALVGFGCGYKAPPSYEQDGAKDTSEKSQNLGQGELDSEFEGEKKKKMLFQEIGAQPTPGYEEDEE